MPTYDYECQRCGKTFEVFQYMSDEPLKRCPECRGKIVRLIGAGAGVIFRGSGFYETDYRSSEYKESARKESEASKGSTGSDDSSKSEKTTSSSDSKKKAPAKSKKGE